MIVVASKLLWVNCFGGAASLWEGMRVIVALAFPTVTRAEQRATVDPGKGKVGPGFPLGRNCFPCFCCMIHRWWINQLPVVLSLVQKWVKSRNSAPCVLLLCIFSFIFPVRVWERTSLNQLVTSKAKVVTDHLLQQPQPSSETTSSEWFWRGYWADLTLSAPVPGVLSSSAGCCS